MLVSFELENWMCFSKPTSISFVAGRERKHREHIIRIQKPKINLLPITAIYGRNASGKTALFKAIEFARNFIINGTQNIDTEISINQFKLDESFLQKPSKFSFEILVNEQEENFIYTLSIALTPKQIIQEELVKNKGFRDEQLIYHRDQNRFDLCDSLKQDKFVEYVKEGTRPNQLFLTNAVLQNAEHKIKEKALFSVYQWFTSNHLVCISPMAQRTYQSENITARISELLANMDTGIEGISSGATIEINSGFPLRAIAKRDSTGDLIFTKMLTQHLDSNGEIITFNLEEESDGTKRLIDLLPEFIDMETPNRSKICLIDEISRSLHPLLVRDIIDRFLDNISNNNRVQLIFTTHDTDLIRSGLLRNDETWIINAIQSYPRELLSFYDFKEIAKERDVSGSYLLGRMGGIPEIRG